MTKTGKWAGAVAAVVIAFLMSVAAEVALMGLRLLVIASAIGGAGVAVKALHELHKVHAMHLENPRVRNPPAAAMQGVLCFLGALIALAATEIGWMQQARAHVIATPAREAIFDLVVAQKSWQLLAVIGLVFLLVAAMQMWGDRKQ